jgi:hypothetical protein
MGTVDNISLIQYKFCKTRLNIEKFVVAFYEKERIIQSGAQYHKLEYLYIQYKYKLLLEKL